MIEVDPQNRAENLRYLAAAQELFSAAGRWRCGQLLIVVALPVGLALWGALYAQATPLIAFAGFFCALLDVALFEPRINSHRYRAAQLAEHFDSRIIGAAPSAVRCCDMPSEEDIETYAGRTLRSAKRSEGLRDWYTDRLMTLQPIPGRVLCQRISSASDEQLRELYLPVLICVALGAVLLLIGITTLRGWTVEHLITNILFPVLPATVWFGRELASQFDARARKQDLRRAIELLWAGLMLDGVISARLEREVDAAQGMHFMYRTIQPSVPWWLSALRRPEQRRALRNTIDAYIAEAQRRGLTVGTAPVTDIGHMEK